MKGELVKGGKARWTSQNERVEVALIDGPYRAARVVGDGSDQPFGEDGLAWLCEDGLAWLCQDDAGRARFLGACVLEAIDDGCCHRKGCSPRCH